MKTSSIKASYIEQTSLTEIIPEPNLEVMLGGAESPMTFEVAEGTLVSNEISIFGQAPLRLYRFEVAAHNAD